EDARRRLLRSHWHLALVVTDLSLRDNGKPVSRRASRTHGVAVVSLPALGPLHVRPASAARAGRARRRAARTGRRAGGRHPARVDRENAERLVILRPLFVTTVLFSHL